MQRLYAETLLGVSFTTNGTLLDAAFLERVAGCYGQMRYSVSMCVGATG